MDGESLIYHLSACGGLLVDLAMLLDEEIFHGASRQFHSFLAISPRIRFEQRHVAWHLLIESLECNNQENQFARTESPSLSAANNTSKQAGALLPAHPCVATLLHANAANR